MGLCDEYSVTFWGSRKKYFDAQLEADVAVCVESYLRSEKGGEGVKLDEQILLTEGGNALRSSFPLEQGCIFPAGC